MGTGLSLTYNDRKSSRTSVAGNGDYYIGTTAVPATDYRDALNATILRVRNTDKDGADHEDYFDDELTTQDLVALYVNLSLIHI